MIEHLRRREEQLIPFGLRPDHAEWIALVCLHSGIFTRAQFCAYFGCRRNRALRFVRRLLNRGWAVEDSLGGLPTTTRPCRIAHPDPYRALEIPNPRHRRSASWSVLFRRLLSLDTVLEHPHHPWLATEAEKVAAFEALGIPNPVFPRRYYHGHAAGQSRYFPLKLPLALDQRQATFVYCDPGRETDKELLSWGAAHAKLWTELRDRDLSVHVVAVSRDRTRCRRAETILRRWTRPGPGAEYQPLTPQEKKGIRRIEQAALTNDQTYLSEYGGFAKAMDYRQMLLDRPGAIVPKGRIRVDRTRTWISSRIPEDEASRDVLV